MQKQANSQAFAVNVTAAHAFINSWKHTLLYMQYKRIRWLYNIDCTWKLCSCSCRTTPTCVGVVQLFKVNEIGLTDVRMDFEPVQSADDEDLMTLN